MEELFKELSMFARENHKALKLAEQWLNEFDNGNLEDAWIIAGQPFDWRKIVFIAWLASDEKIYECKLEMDGFDLRQWCGCDKNKGGDTEQKGFLFNVIYRIGVSYTTPKNPSFYLIRSALEEGKKALTLDKNEADNELLPPLNTANLWSCPNLGKLREIDSNTKRDGIAGDKQVLKRLQEYTAKRGPKRKDIAETLYHENGRIKTTMAHHSMFNQK